MMREVFEAFLTDPIRVNEDVFALWLEGHNAGDALAARLRLPSAVPMPYLGGDAAAKLRELLWRDTVDQYRLYDKLEHYLSQPSLFRSQLLFQIPPVQQYYMVERYYTRDPDVDRWLLGKKLSGRLEKDLDDVAESSGRTLKSCRRQLENLRRVYAAVEDRNFHGLPCRAVSELFLLSETLSSKYACLLFILHTRFQVHPQHPVTGFLTWSDLRFFAALLMTHWLPQRKRLSKLQFHKGPPDKDTEEDSVVENGAQIALRSPSTGEWPAIGFLQEKLQPTSVRETVGLDLSHPLTNCLRDLKAHLINDNDVLRVYREKIMSQLRSWAAAKGTLSESAHSLSELESKLYLVVHGFLTIGAGLSQPKELQHLLEYLLARVVRVLHDCEVTKSQLNALFSALVDALAELDVWYLNGQETRGLLLAGWDRFISVCRAVILTVYDRCHPSAIVAYQQAMAGDVAEELMNASMDGASRVAVAFETQAN
ncbi:Acidic fibroblast growth factor intracellular-binding protein [Phytophthora citrophthora]|uniref:Acidic fibroblast growth factor intracellular-binding protein n=1 Tax=Phytophthora citrophthora TaxID=4793 RepID=A0AAD9GR67_9STRA|nr:Acidic fibroblast growth factor intracellular-binding protein [Phytophthora citrophthora]